MKISKSHRRHASNVTELIPSEFLGEPDTGKRLDLQALLKRPGHRKTMSMDYQMMSLYKEADFCSGNVKAPQVRLPNRLRIPPISPKNQ